MEFKQIKYIDRKTGNTLIENVPGEKFLKFLYYNPFGKLPLELLVKRKFLSVLYGKKMDSKNSCKIIPEFVKEHSINMDESIKQIDDFTSFNDFFTRELKPNSRKIDQRDSVLASPADGKVFVIENISENTKFFAKGEEFTLTDFFRNKNFAKKYKNGIMFIIRLAPVDYHRYHFPADGMISKSKTIEGAYYSVSTHAVRQNFRIFCENKRSFSTLFSDFFKDICIAEIGATMVGGIKQTYIPYTHVKKGDEKGYFFFGGSTVILLLEKQPFKIDEDILKNSRNGLETKVYMGESLGSTLRVRGEKI
ncbi:phosphatidylserine decarboxylase [Fusobacterium sp.]|uniref:phosphatidylserine decarboxylase n=1 Tax=Fusobacterium sp. TaxID=68766 RepID=UPI00260A2249|nr:phosphatidylserine decarboxylase [Fusobacterium sp.]